MDCEFRIQGHLSPSWREWLHGMTVTQGEGAETVVKGQVVDQAALLGIINRLHALNLRLLAVCCCESPPDDPPT